MSNFKKPILPKKEEIVKIKKGDIEVINKYYLLNYELIKNVAKSYCASNRLKNNLFEDITDECFKYFQKFNFENAVRFIRSIKDIAVFVRWGGERVYHQVRQGNTEILTILDEPIFRQRRHGGEPITFGETIVSPFDIIEEIEPTKLYTDEVYKIVLKFLTKREKEAFKYFYYTDLTAKEIGLKMGISINGAQSLKNSYMRKLRKNSLELLELLYKHNINEFGKAIV